MFITYQMHEAKHKQRSSDWPLAALSHVAQAPRRVQFQECRRRKATES